MEVVDEMVLYEWQVCTLWDRRAVDSNDATRTSGTSHSVQRVWSDVGQQGKQTERALVWSMRMCKGC